MDRTVQLVSAARENDVEVVFVQHDAGPGSGLSAGDEGFEIIDEMLPEPGEKVFVKTINSCFGNKDLKKYLKHQKDKRLMIIGLQTNYCIDATVKSAFERGFKVIIPEEIIHAITEFVNYYNDDVWEGLVDAVTLEEAIELLKE